MILEVIRGLGMGGAETLLYRRLKYAREQNLPEFAETTVVSTAPHLDHYKNPLLDLGVRVIESPNSNPLAGMIVTSRLLSKADINSAAIFHSPSTAYLTKLQRRLSLPSNSRKYAIVDVAHSTRYRPIYHKLNRILDPGADFAMAVSEDVSNARTTAYHKRTQVIHAGVDIDDMRTWLDTNPYASVELRTPAGIPLDVPLIVTVGSLIPLKGHRRVVEALTDPRLGKVHLAIVGAGPERSNLQQLAGILEVSDRVHLVGRVANGWHWTAIADVLVHPSDFEGLPLTLIEAAALGTPIIATDVGGVKEIFDYGACGSLLEKPTPQRIAEEVSRQLAAQADKSDSNLKSSTNSYWTMERFVSEYYKTINRLRRFDVNLHHSQEPGE